MKFSLWNFRDWFEAHGISLSYRISDTEAQIEHVLLGASLLQAEPGEAMIVPGEILPDCSGFRTALCYQNDRLLFPTASETQILNLSNEMAEYYDSLEIKFMDDVASGCSITDLLKKISEVLSFPLAVLTESKELLYVSPDWKIILPPSIREKVRKTGRGKKKAGSFFYLSDPDISGNTLLSVPVEWKKDSFLWLLVDDDASRLTPGDVNLFRLACEIMKKAFLFRMNQAASFHPLSEWFSSVISSETAQEPISPGILDTIQWKENDTFQIACIRFLNRVAQRAETIRMLSDADHCCSFSPEGFAVLIHSRLPFAFADQKNDPLLSALSDNADVRIGISLPFYSLKETAVFYRQAYASFDDLSDNKNNCTRMIDRLADRILEKCRSIPDVKSYIHPEIKHLAELEKTEKEPWTETLFMYLILGRSAAHTAAALYIHRNTLRARLDKIQSMLSFPIETSEDIEQILISLIIMS